MSIAREDADRYADHHVRMMPIFLGHKGPERMAAAIERARDYANDTLAHLVIGRECLREMYDGDYD